MSSLPGRSSDAGPVSAIDQPATEEKDWRDYAFDAQRFIKYAVRAEALAFKIANLYAAKHQIEMALEKLGGQ